MTYHVDDTALCHVTIRQPDPREEHHGVDAFTAARWSCGFDPHKVPLLPITQPAAVTAAAPGPRGTQDQPRQQQERRKRQRMGPGQGQMQQAAPTGSAMPPAVARPGLAAGAATPENDIMQKLPAAVDGAAGGAAVGGVLDGQAVPRGLRSLPADIVRAARKKEGQAGREAVAFHANEESIVISGLPLLADMVHNTMSHERRDAVYADELANRLLQTHKKKAAGVNEAVIARQTELLLQLAPDWCEMQQVALQTRPARSNGVAMEVVEEASHKLFVLCIPGRHGRAKDAKEAPRYSEVRRRLVAHVEAHRAAELRRAAPAGVFLASPSRPAPTLFQRAPHTTQLS
jgi:hypothetical protein